MDTNELTQTPEKTVVPDRKQSSSAQQHFQHPADVDQSSSPTQLPDERRNASNGDATRSQTGPRLKSGLHLIGSAEREVHACHCFSFPSSSGCSRVPAANQGHWVVRLATLTSLISPRMIYSVGANMTAERDQLTSGDFSDLLCGQLNLGMPEHVEESTMTTPQGIDACTSTSELRDHLVNQVVISEVRSLVPTRNDHVTAASSAVVRQWKPATDSSEQHEAWWAPTLKEGVCTFELLADVSIVPCYPVGHVAEYPPCRKSCPPATNAQYLTERPSLTIVAGECHRPATSGEVTRCCRDDDSYGPESPRMQSVRPHRPCNDVYRDAASIAHQHIVVAST
jgi:hypothetical protein